LGRTAAGSPPLFFFFFRSCGARDLFLGPLQIWRQLHCATCYLHNLLPPGPLVLLFLDVLVALLLLLLLVLWSSSWSSSCCSRELLGRRGESKCDHLPREAGAGVFGAAVAWYRTLHREEALLASAKLRRHHH
jgi:hypothetical protein